MAKHVIASLREFPAGTRKLVDIKGRQIAVFNIKGEFFALANRCPHQGGSLCDGRLTGLVEVDRARPVPLFAARRDHPLPVARLGVRRAHRQILVRPVAHPGAAILGFGGARRGIGRRPLRGRDVCGQRRRRIRRVGRMRQIGMAQGRLRLAADIGGTFTDIAVFDEKSGKLTFGKALSTPAHLVEGISAPASPRPAAIIAPPGCSCTARPSPSTPCWSAPAPRPRC